MGAQTRSVAAFAPGSRVLFQGDSITDMNRGRTADPNHILGHGYVFVIASRYGAAYPERKLVFMNRGVSGNTVADLASRWQDDTIELKPDVLSILIGINDMNRGVSVEQYEDSYDKLLARTVDGLPNAKLVLIEPFGLPVAKYAGDSWPQTLANLRARQTVVAKLAAKYHAALVHAQKAMESAVERAPADYWMWDGIHPTYSGHQILADEWVKVVDAAWK